MSTVNPSLNIQDGWMVSLKPPVLKNCSGRQRKRRSLADSGSRDPGIGLGHDPKRLSVFNWNYVPRLFDISWIFITGNM